MMVEQLFLTVPPGCLQFVIVVSPDHTHLLFLGSIPWGDFMGGAEAKNYTFSKYGHVAYQSKVKEV